MKKIIHMSDLHLGYGEAGGKFRELAARLKSTINGAAPEYVIVITGDLVHSATGSSYREAQDGIESLKDLGFADVLAVPGNHDYRSDSSRIWRRRDAANVGKFQRTFFGQETGYPKLDIVPAGGGPAAIAFIGLDSMNAVLRRSDAVYDNGEFEMQQLVRLGDLFQREDVRGCGRRVVYFHHHPFSSFPIPGPRGARALQELIADVTARGISIDALLYGHTHFGGSDHGRWGVPRCYNAGTATNKPRPKAINWLPAFKPKAATRLIDLQRNETEVDLLILN